MQADLSNHTVFATFNAKGRFWYNYNDEDRGGHTRDASVAVTISLGPLPAKSDLQEWFSEPALEGAQCVHVHVEPVEAPEKERAWSFDPYTQAYFVGHPDEERAIGEAAVKWCLTKIGPNAPITTPMEGGETAREVALVLKGLARPGAEDWRTGLTFAFFERAATSDEADA